MKWLRWRFRFSRRNAAFHEGERRGFDAGYSAGLARGWSTPDARLVSRRPGVDHRCIP